MSLDKKLDKAFGIVKEEQLHPPTAPKYAWIDDPKEVFEEAIVSETSINEVLEREPAMGIGMDIDSELTLDFNTLSWTEAKQWLLDNSSFDRSLMEFVKKVVPGLEGVEVRGSKKVMVKSFNKNVQNFTGVINEFKEKVEKLKGRRIE